MMPLCITGRRDIGFSPLVSPDTGLIHGSEPQLPFKSQYAVGVQVRNVYMKTHHFWVVSTTILSLAISPLVVADDATQLDTVVVTADRKARSVDDTLVPVSVLTRKDIERYQASSVQELLTHIGGVSISNNGGAGQLTGVRLRGANSNQTLVLLDGIKINMASAGLASFEHLPIDNIERIEVVHGSRSSLYGSEAIGGVIQIFTRKGKTGFHPEVSIQAGSHNRYKLNTNLNGGNGTTWYNLNVGKEQTDGFNACNPSKGCFVNEPDKDGYQRQTASLRAGHKVTQQTDAELLVSQTSGDVQYDGATNQAYTVQQISSIKIKHSFKDRAVISAQLGQATDKATNHTASGAISGRYDNRRHTANLQADVQTSPNGNLTLGLEQQTDKLSSDLAYSRTSRDNKAAFASYQHQLGQNKFDIAARHDHNEQFGSKNTGSISLGHEFNNGLRATASYATAFKAPTFNDLYYPSSAYYQPNPNLHPENARNVELGLSGKLAKGQWSVNAFQNRIDDLIVYDFPTMKNLDKAQIKGIESSVSTQVAGLKVQGNLTLQQPENRTGTLNGKQLSYRPKQLASVDVDKSVGKWTVGATVRGESKRYTNAANTDILAGYGTVDLRASYALNKDWTVGAKLANVLDKDYQTNKGYNQDGINGLITLKYAPH